MQRRNFLTASLAATGLASVGASERAFAQSGGGWGLIDVRAFGARGDGTTDDTAAVRAAIAAVRNHPPMAFPQSLRCFYDRTPLASPYRRGTQITVTMRHVDNPAGPVKFRSVARPHSKHEMSRKGEQDGGCGGENLAPELA